MINRTILPFLGIPPILLVGTMLTFLIGVENEDKGDRHFRGGDHAL